MSRALCEDMTRWGQVDREATHIASAVLQLFQECDQDGGWPLEVVGEDGGIREVYLQPGEMVLYEGSLAG